MIAQEQPLTEQGYEGEELGVNPYTAPSIARIFQQLDDLRPLSFEQLQREFPKVSPPGREQKGLIFGRTDRRWIPSRRSRKEKCNR